MIPPVLFCSVHIAYYLWYGNPVHDGKWMHWDHKTLPHWDPPTDKKFPKSVHDPAHDRAHSPYRPRRGFYSSRDPETMTAHFQEIAAMGIDSVMFSWWGRASLPGLKRDDADSGANTDLLVRLALRTAKEYASTVRLSFHVEPYEGRSAATFERDCEYIGEEYVHAAGSEFQAFFVYDVSSRHTPRAERHAWRSALTRIRHLYQEKYGVAAFFFCLWVEGEKDLGFVQEVGFDGGYSYFAATRFTPASDAGQWPRLLGSPGMAAHFVPSVGPGYDDTRIRPWNAHNRRSREDQDSSLGATGVGASNSYYDRMWRNALDYKMVTITSYNEWGESTQIEPAEVHQNNTALPFPYLSYPANDPHFYLRKTKKWVAEFKQKCAERYLGGGDLASRNGGGKTKEATMRGVEDL
mmetsp:Transcript_6379/g.15787  ORF Transcript_6379/g.15787 Transcript_6379/m.15787 type:complete len:408 (+) Transcript_6379:239-1462(+)|eukprot:g9202.t1